MKLSDDWRLILRKAWSVRLGILAGVLSGMEAVVPLFIDTLPRGVFAALSMLSVAGAMIARLVAQRDFDDGR